MNNEKLFQSLKEVIPKNGLVYSEKNNLNEILCKPKILPLKSLSLQKLEEMENQLIIQSKNTENLKN